MVPNQSEKTWSVGHLPYSGYAQRDGFMFFIGLNLPNCIYNLPIDSKWSLVPFGSESIGKLWIQSDLICSTVICFSVCT